MNSILGWFGAVLSAGKTPHSVANSMNTPPEWWHKRGKEEFCSCRIPQEGRGASISIKLHSHLLLPHQGVSEWKTRKFSTPDAEGTEVMDGLDELWIYFPLEGRSICCCSSFPPLSLQNILFLTKALGGLEATSIKAWQSYNIQSLVKTDGEEQLLSLLQWFSAKPFTLPRAVSALTAQSHCSGSWASTGVWNLSIWNLNPIPQPCQKMRLAPQRASVLGANLVEIKQALSRGGFVLTATF